MSVHFDVSSISFFGLDNWSVAVCAWRGCCMEVFSRAEHSVADCLRALEKAGFRLNKDARHSSATTRLRALGIYIAQHDFGGHGNAALQRIVAWERVCERRAMIAHGEIRATADGIMIRHTTFDGKAETRLPPVHLSKLEMLVTLREIEEAQEALHHQLGQIEALANTVRPLAGPVRKPDPGSRPV